MEKKEYLGDSVYVQNDGFGLILTTENEPNKASNTIYLEPSVYQALVDYVGRISKQNLERC